jgi:ABC-type multidrug transport system fused ATPase/permease subunit
VRGWRSFARLFDGSGRLVALSVALALGQSLALVPIGLLVRRAFDTAIPQGDRGELVLLGATVVALFAAAAGLGLASRHVMLKSTKRAVLRLRSDLLARIQALPRAWLDREDVARVHATVVQDSERADVMANAVLAIVLPAAVVATALLASLAFIDLELLALLLAVLPVLVALGRWLNHRALALVHVYQRTFDTFSGRILSNLRALVTIRAQVAEEAELRAGRGEIARLSEEGRRLAWAWQLHAAAQGTTAALAGMLVLVLGGLRVIDGSMSLGALLSFFGVLALVRGQVTTALTWVPQVVVGREALARLERLMDADADQPYRGRRRIAFEGRLDVDDVTFGYGGQPVLRDLRLSLAGGERVALTGPNGAGKSTLVALVLGLYRPDVGALRADGVAYDELDLRELRRGIGVLLQDPVLFRGSVRDNIAYGAEAASDAEVEAAAVAAIADEVVAHLPEGYATEVGTDGQLLSGGERQRIALARALLGRPPLLVLDEPSSHLDDETTARLLDRLRDLDWTPAVLLITHDPAVARAADRVVELRDGRVVAAVA